MRRNCQQKSLSSIYGKHSSTGCRYLTDGKLNCPALIQQQFALQFKFIVIQSENVLSLRDKTCCTIHRSGSTFYSPQVFPNCYYISFHIHVISQNLQLPSYLMNDQLFKDWLKLWTAWGKLFLKAWYFCRAASLLENCYTHYMKPVKALSAAAMTVLLQTFRSVCRKTRRDHRIFAPLGSLLVMKHLKIDDMLLND